MTLSTPLSAVPDVPSPTALDNNAHSGEDLQSSFSSSSLPAFHYSDKMQAALCTLGQWLQETQYQFTTVTPVTHARVNERPENAQALTLQGIFGWSRPFDAALLPPEIFQLLQDAGIVIAQGPLWRSQLRVSTLDGVLFFHSAFPTDAADAVFFGPDTYRFIRVLKQHARERQAPVRRAVDIGCGAGPGALTLAQLYPQADVLGVDINPTALALTRLNAHLAQLEQVQPCHSNLLHQLEGDFDLIIANPPYLVDAGKRAYRHGGGALGAGLSWDIVQAALSRLTLGGSLLLYTGVAILDGQDPFRLQIAELLAGQVSRFSWEYEEIDPDVFGEELLRVSYASAERIAAVALTLTLTRQE